ncbi:MAG: hypothetical protein ACLT0O_04360 [Sutterella wadsworthensis]
MSSIISLDQVPLSPEAEAQKITIDAGKDVASGFSDNNKTTQKEPRQAATPEVTQVSGQRYTRAFLTMQVSLKSNTAFQIVMYNFRRFNDAMANATFVLRTSPPRKRFRLSSSSSTTSSNSARRKLSKPTTAHAPS